MKKIRMLVSGMLVFAVGLGLCACKQQPVESVEVTTTVSETEEGFTVPVVSESEPDDDPWNGYQDASDAVGATAIASQCLGKSVDDILSGGALREFWSGSSCSFCSDQNRQVLIPDGGFTINGYDYDQIYLWKDNADNITRVTFMTRHNEYLPMTEAETKGAEKDMNYDAIEAYINTVLELQDAFGSYTNGGASYLNTADGETFIFEHNGTEIVVTYGVDCYGIKGNNEFKIDVYPSGKTFAENPEEDFRLLVYKLSYCMGRDYAEARDMVEDALGVELRDEFIDNTGYIYYSVDADIEGVGFNQVIIIPNEGNGEVYEIHLVNDMSSMDDAEGYYDLFEGKLRTVFGNYFIPWNNPVYDGELIRVGADGCYCIIGGRYDDTYSRFQLIMNNESLREE